MARTESKMVALGMEAPAFTLPDVVSGRTITLETFAGQEALLVMFICRHCPYVKHLQEGIAAIGRDYADKPVGIVAISSNDATAYPDDAPEGLRSMAAELGFQFPYCYDESQDVARAYQAVCTPDFYVFDQRRRLLYHGQMDESRRNSDVLVSGRDVRAALDAILSGQVVPADQKASIGCSIKWKS